MKKGIEISNLRVSQIIALAAILLPTMLVMYGILVLAGIAEKPPLYHSIGAMISLGGLVLTMLLAALSSKNLIFYRHTFIMLAVTGILYSITVSGFVSYLAICWVALSTGAYLVMGQKGFIFSSLAMYTAAILNIIGQNFAQTPSIIITFVATVVTVVSGVIIEISRIQNVDLNELNEAKSGERLQSSRISAIINNINDAVISTDPNGVIEVYNSAALSLIDTNKDLKGEPIEEILSLRQVDDNKRARIVEIGAKSPKFLHRDDLYFKSAGQKVRIEIDRSVLKSKDYEGENLSRNKILGYVFVIRDITRAKSVEEEKDEFISVVSHELRTPITIAEGSLSNINLMVERLDNVKPATLKAGLNEAHEQVIFLSRMVNDLSTLSRAERGLDDKPERINLNDFLHDLFNEYLKRAERNHLSLNLDVDPQLGYATVSQLYLKELLQNFITNALKYTKEGSVTIIARNQADSIYLAVKDTGIGISKSDQAKVFEKFFRSEDYRTRETRGTGLGLYVCQKLAKKLDTQIEVKSRLNHGSTFSFNLKKDAEK